MTLQLDWLTVLLFVLIIINLTPSLNYTPELPDVEVFTRNLYTMLAGPRLVKITIVKRVLKKEIPQLFKNCKGKINVEVKDFLKISTKNNKISARQAHIAFEKKGIIKIYYRKEQLLYK